MIGTTSPSKQNPGCAPAALFSVNVIPGDAPPIGWHGIVKLRLFDSPVKVFPRHVG
jgi:hypothetical protein